MIKKIIKKPIVYRNIFKASFLNPSIYRRIGLPRTNEPVIVAEIINSNSTKIGVMAVSFTPKMSLATDKK